MNIKSIQMLFVIFNTLFINNINGRNQDKTSIKKNKNLSKHLANNPDEKSHNNERIYQSTHIGPIKCVRVVRQAGYRYERPSVSFDLPADQGAGSSLPGPSSPKQNNYPRPPSAPAPQPSDDYSYPAPVEISPQRPSSTTPRVIVQSSSGSAEGYQSNSAPSVNSLMYPSVSVNIQSNNAENPSQNAGDYSYPQPPSSQPPSVINNSPSYSYQQPTQSPSPSPAPSQQPYSYPQPTGSSTGSMSTPGPPYLPPLRGSTPQPSPPAYSYAQSSTQNASPISSTPGPPYLPPKLSSNPTAPSSNLYEPPSGPRMVIVVQEQSQNSHTPDNTYLRPGATQGLDVRTLSKPKDSPENKYIPPSMNSSPIHKPSINKPPSVTYLTQAISSISSQAPAMISPSTTRSVEKAYLAPNSEYGPPNVVSNSPKSYVPPDSGNRATSVTAVPFSPSNSYGSPVSGYGPSVVTAKTPPNPSKSYVPAKPTGFQRPATSFPTSPSLSTPASMYLPPYK